MGRKKDAPTPPPPSSRPPKPSTGCTSCDYVWVEARGEWVPSWSMNCTVHASPSEL